MELRDLGLGLGALTFLMGFLSRIFSGESEVHEAIQKGDLEAVNIALQNGAQINQTDKVRFIAEELTGQIR